MAAYLKPAGYGTLAFVNGLVGRWYKPFNNYISGSRAYGVGGPSAQRATFTFSAAPANGSQITVPDGPVNQPGGPNLKTFTFTYSGSPGAGIIPLVAGGGTAAQAATAAFTALNAQLTNWVATNGTPTVMVLTSRQPGVNSGPGLVGSTNAVITSLLSSFAAVLPARFGKNYAFLPAASVPAVGS